MRIMLRAIVPANLTINIGQTIPAAGGMYSGGKVSMYQTIDIKTASLFELDDMEKSVFAGGKVGILHVISLESEVV